MRLTSGACRRLRRRFAGESVGRVFVSINPFAATDQTSACECDHADTDKSGLPGAKQMLTLILGITAINSAKAIVNYLVAPDIRSGEVLAPINPPSIHM